MKLQKAFSLIELSIVVLIIGVVTIVALSGKSLLVKANCVVSTLGSKSITDNLNNPTALTKNRSSAYESCVSAGGPANVIVNCSGGLTCSSCKAVLNDNPGSPSGTYKIDPDGNGGLASFTAYCDMETDGGGWTLVAVSNSSNSIASVDNTFNVANNYTGNYVKRLTGLYGTDQMFDCGTTDQGVKGLIILNNGAWNWPNSSTLQVTKNFSVKSSNLIWNPDLPGYDSPDATFDWNNRHHMVHYGNIGSSNFISVIYSNNVNVITVFSCDVQNNNPIEGWFSGATGTRYVRYWLR